MSESEIRSLLALIVPSINWSVVTLDASLEEAGLDSLDKANLIMEIEGILSIKIDDSEYEKLDSIQNLIALGK